MDSGIRVMIVTLYQPSATQARLARAAPGGGEPRSGAVAALLDLGGADTRGYTAVSIAPSELS